MRMHWPAAQATAKQSGYARILLLLLTVILALV
jgi:hypothetical protein